MNSNVVRNLTAAERRQRFVAYRQQEEARSLNPDTGAQWHLVDDPMTLHQVHELPAARQAEDTRTVLLWVKFKHPWTRKITVSKGFFDYDGGGWTVRFESDQYGGYCGRIAPVAWTQVVPEQLPWNGPMIRSDENVLQ